MTGHKEESRRENKEPKRGVEKKSLNKIPGLERVKEKKNRMKGQRRGWEWFRGGMQQEGDRKMAE